MGVGATVAAYGLATANTSVACVGGIFVFLGGMLAIADYYMAKELLVDP